MIHLQTPRMVAIPGGTFLMGSPEGERWAGPEEMPQHEVTVRPFFMGRYPITQIEWKGIASRQKLKVERDLAFNPSRFNDKENSDRRPVECVNWYDAVEYCARLSRLTGREYRLPSEAEWEYACRAGTKTPFYTGDKITRRQANFRSQGTTPVGQFPPNPFDLYDMAGNVWEWCADNWHDNYEGAPNDGSAWLKGGSDARSLLRGGSWFGIPDFCRSAYRSFEGRVYCGRSVGFRVACSAGSI